MTETYHEQTPKAGLGLFLVKAALFTALLLALQVGVSLVFGGQPPPSWLDRPLNDTLQESPEIVFLGDSSVFSHPPDADDMRPTCVMLGDLLPEYKVRALLLPGMLPTLDAAILRRLQSEGLHPRYVVICMNHSTLRPYAAGALGRQYVESRLFLEHDGLLLRSFLRPISILKGIDSAPRPRDEHLRFLAKETGVSLKRVRRVDEAIRTNTAMANHRDFLQLYFAAHYSKALHAKHHELKALQRCAELARAMGAEPIFYLTPINHELMQDAAGHEMGENVQRDSRIIQEALAEGSANVVDLSVHLPIRHFYESPLPTTHYDAEGRMQVAEQLAAEIRRLDAALETAHGAEPGPLP